MTQTMKVSRDFKGVWVSKEMIKELGFPNALFVSAYLCGAPLTKRQMQIVRKLMPKNQSPQQIKVRVLQKKGKLKCQWCNQSCYSLQEHHFPVGKKYGGTEVVQICGKCHSDYHFLYDLYGR